jgi:hypothetical protein
VRLLTRVLPEAAAVLDLLPAPSVLAFAGHLIDASDRAAPRLPRRWHRPSTPRFASISRACTNRSSTRRPRAAGPDPDRGGARSSAESISCCRSIATTSADERRGGDGWLPRFDSALARPPGDHATQEVISATTCCSSTRRC